jgi:hypothetical protein
VFHNLEQKRLLMLGSKLGEPEEIEIDLSTAPGEHIEEHPIVVRTSAFLLLFSVAIKMCFYC